MEPSHPDNMRPVQQPDGSFALERKDGQEVCDFCSDPRVVCQYPCRDFVVGYVLEPDGSMSQHWNRGAFSACEPCRDLIDAGHYQLVVERQCRGWAARYGGDAGMRAEFELIIALFVKHRSGPARDRS